MLEERDDGRGLTVADLDREHAAGSEHAQLRPERAPRTNPPRTAPAPARALAPRARDRPARPRRCTAGSRRRAPTGQPGDRRGSHRAPASPRAPFARRSPRQARAPRMRRRSPSRARRGARPRSRVRSRRFLSRRPGLVGAGRSAIATSALSTSVSVSGLGISARESTLRVSRRKPHSPRMYCTGSRCALRATSSLALTSSSSTSGRSRYMYSSIRSRPSALPSNSSASSRGVGEPRLSRCSVVRRITSPIVIARGSEAFERLSAIFGGERVGELLEIALEDLVEPMNGQLDPMVGEPVLREVVGADLLGSVTGADLCLPRRSKLGLLALALVPRRAAPGARASPCSCSGAATSRPASRRRSRSAYG